MGALAADLTWKAVGSLREGQRPRDTRDGPGEGKGRGRGELCQSRGPEGDRLDEVTVATGWAGEAAVRTCGPK